MTSAQEDEEPRYYGLELGVVTDDADPEGRGRVKFRIPGIMDDSPWAPPIGTMGGGGPQRGMFAVPPLGSDIGVLFHRGDPESPYYLSGHWGTPAAGSEVPTPVRDAEDRSKAHLIAAFETSRWLVTYDDRPTKELLRLEDKESETSVELDGKTLAITVKGETQVSITSGGLVNIDGLEVQIAGRKVLRNGRPI